MFSKSLLEKGIFAIAGALVSRANTFEPALTMIARYASRKYDDRETTVRKLFRRWASLYLKHIADYIGENKNFPTIGSFAKNGKEEKLESL